MYDIFLSYRRTDGKLAAALVQELQARGVEAWYDQMIQGGVDWREDIVGNLTNSRILVILFSEACNSSKQLNKELAIADHLDKTVVPVLIEKTEPRGNYLYELASRNWIEMHPRPASKVKELADHLVGLVAQEKSGGGGTSAEGGGAAPQQVEVDALKARRARSQRDLLPFRWWDLFMLGLLFGGTLYLEKNQGWDFFGTLQGLDLAGAMALLFLALTIVYGAIIFPMRYYLRGRGLVHSMVKYLLSNLILVLVFFAVLLAWGSRPGR